MIVGLETLLGQSQPGLAELRELLGSLFEPGPIGELIGHQRINDRVHRLCFEAPGRRRNVVVKRMDPDIARRNQLLVTRWLPFVGLERLGPVLLGVAAKRTGDSVWHAYEDLGDQTLDVAAPDSRDVEQAVRAVAMLHTRFAGHFLLGECRLWGGDLGVRFFTGSLHDAIAALRWLGQSATELNGDLAAVRDRLLRRLTGLLDEFPRRAEELAEFGGPETLLHGDLWRQNIALLPDGAGRVRLLDWDHVAVGPIAYDLSTLLLRFPRVDRPWVFDTYRRAVEPAGWQLSDPSRLNAVFDTVEQARIANRVIWPAIAILEGDRGWGPGALAEVDRWFDALAPVLPEGPGP
jgi:hypothetical protein